jgi:hypothetical protein
MSLAGRRTSWVTARGRRHAPGVSASILEGLDEMLTVIRLGLPISLCRSLASTNIIKNMMGTVRRVCRNVKRWRDASMALRWPAAAMQEAVNISRRSARRDGWYTASHLSPDRKPYSPARSAAS